MTKNNGIKSQNLINILNLLKFPLITDKATKLTQINKGNYRGLYSAKLPYDKIKYSTNKEDYKIDINQLKLLEKQKHEKAHKTKTKYNILNV